MDMLEPVLAAIDGNFDDRCERLFELLRINSISTDPAYAVECRRAAEWLAANLKTSGFSASVRDTAGHPIVVVHHDGPAPDAPHALFYGHYDVQPVDPVELWDFDDKGQLMLFVEACRTWKQVHGALPCRLTLLFEGEEESGSPSLKPFLEANADELKADFALVCDTGMWGSDTPAICMTLRGLIGDEIVVRAANRDLHSGHYGGAAANPIHILSKILADIHDDAGRVAIPGFYDGVEETPRPILNSWEKLASSGTDLLGEVGLSAPSGEQGRSVLELIWARPTAEVNGVVGGYTGDGCKTVIAAEASAKVSFRLVNGQDPHKIRAAFREFARECIPADRSVEFQEHGASGAIRLDHDSPLMTKAASALSDEWPNQAVLVGMGGSIPIVGDFQSMLGMESILTGFARDDDNIYSPNEKYDLSSFHRGQRFWARILHAISN